MADTSEPRYIRKKYCRPLPRIQCLILAEVGSYNRGGNSAGCHPFWSHHQSLSNQFHASNPRYDRCGCQFLFEEKVKHPAKDGGGNKCQKIYNTSHWREMMLSIMAIYGFNQNMIAFTAEFILFDKAAFITNFSTISALADEIERII